MKTPYISHFRPLYEARAVAGWALLVVGLPFSGMPHVGIAEVAALVPLVYRAAQVRRALRFRLGISTKWLSFVRMVELLQVSRRMKASQDAMYLGSGFEWTQQHCQIAHEILRMPPGDIPGMPAGVPAAIARYLEKRLAPPASVLDATPQGKSWIHGLEPRKIEVPLHYKALGGHTAVAGTTGAGKTRTYELIASQVIHNPNTVLLVIDPKNDRDLRLRLAKECERAGRKFLYWKQAAPSESIRLNPLENWSQPSEIPSRIAQLMEEGPFRDFAFLFIDRAVKGELYVGDKPNLRSIRAYAESGINNLLDRCLKRFFPEAGMRDWEDRVHGFMQRVAQQAGATMLDGMVQLYTERFTHTGHGHEVIDGLVATFNHDREHYMRIIASALPLLQMLATGETGLMLAPKADDFEDEREIWDIDRIIRQRAVLMVGLDSMSNSIVSKAIASMLLADTASTAGAIYNFYDSPPDVVLIIDEVAEALNEQVIQILNKGRGAGFKAFVAFQSRSDLEAKLGNSAKMLQVLGNLNNQIVLRLEDIDTAQWFSDKVGETAIRNVVTTASTSSASESHIGEFGGSISRSAQLEKVPLIPPRLITELPNLQYFMRISGGAVYQGRIPIIKD